MLKPFCNVFHKKIILKTFKIFRVIYRSFVSTIRLSQNIKQKSTQQLIQTN